MAENEGALPRNPESNSSEVVENVPLCVLIGAIDDNIQKLSRHFRNTSELIKDEMHEDPFLGWYVQKQMKAALTAGEAKLIGETALVVYKVVKATPPLQETGEIVEVGATPSMRDWIDIAEQDIAVGRMTNGNDKNSIYRVMQKYMWRHPELTNFVAQNMGKSVSLEEANLVGETALGVYIAENYSLSSHVK